MVTNRNVKYLQEYERKQIIYIYISTSIYQNDKQNKFNIHKIKEGTIIGYTLYNAIPNLVAFQ